MENSHQGDLEATNEQRQQTVAGLARNRLPFHARRQIFFRKPLLRLQPFPSRRRSLCRYPWSHWKRRIVAIGLRLQYLAGGHLVRACKNRQRLPEDKNKNQNDGEGDKGYHFDQFFRQQISKVNCFSLSVLLTGQIWYGITRFHFDEISNQLFQYQGGSKLILSTMRRLRLAIS